MDIEQLLRTLQTALGIGLVIFVHELGHFIAARLCNVRVDVFSLGFGPKLLGWRRGATLYQLAALPIGGYCRMAGEDPAQAEARPAPDELRAKSVGQRFFIYSGGVLMNVLFGIVVMPLVLFYGVSMDEPVIGQVESGGPAWVAGIEPGTRVLAINGANVPSFEYIAQGIALGPPDSAELVVQGPRDSAPRTLHVTPRYEERFGMSTIGVRMGGDRQGAIKVAPDSPAFLAGLRDEDRIVRVVGGIEELPLDEQLSVATRAGAALVLRVADASGVERELSIEPKWIELDERVLLGVFPAINVVADLRKNADLTALGLHRGDRIVSVAGRRVITERDLEGALLAAPNGVASFEVERAGERLTLQSGALDRSRALALANDIALESDLSRCEVGVSARAAVANVMQDGDRVLAANGVEISDWTRDFLPIAHAAAEARASLTLRVLRTPLGATPTELEITATPGPQSVPDYGFARREARYTYRAASFGEALRVGFLETWRFATDAWTMLKRMVLGQVSSKHMGGIVSIGMVAYSVAEMGIAKLLFFLCMLSVNLAFINVLPVPLLDGGHLLFLVIEKIKGSPVSERVFGYSQVVGLVLILTLLLYVTYNDVMRAVS
ncbi:MAG: site-2 protease family protein [Planctomycetes bacterium]|nr:site-2 protease family protein [Planctomycetota bacterium]